MKYIKKYENINPNIKVGDYVLVNSSFTTKALKEFINNTIGQLTRIEKDYFITVKYTKIPSQLRKNFDVFGKRTFQISSIVESDEDIEKLKLKISASKYNI